MNHTYTYLAGFIIASIVTVISGLQLSKYGDMIADMKGWGKMFVGILLMASITSLPEVITGISAVVVVDAPDLAVGDIVGSCAFNILIISIMDLFYDGKRPLTSAAQVGHVLSAALGIILLCIVALAIVLPSVFGNVGWVGGYSFVFLALYIIIMRIIYLYDTKHIAESATPPSYLLTLRQAIIRYAVAASFLIAAAMTLPYFGEHLAEASGLGQSFFGTLFIAISTSLPEIAVCIGAVRMGTIDMAIGNVFGSNIFNIATLALIDVAYTKGPIFSHTHPNHILPTVATIIITAIGISGIVYKPGKKWKLAIDTGLILLVYVWLVFVLYTNK